MNILVLSDAVLPDHVGGISKSLFVEMKELAARQHAMVVVSKRLKRDSPLYELRDGYEHYRYWVPDPKSIFYRLYPFFSLREIPLLVARLHKDFHFDVAYVHNPFQAVALGKCPASIKYAYVFYAPATLEIELDALGGKYGWATPLVRLVNWWVKMKEKEALARAERIIVRSKFIEKEMSQLYREVGTHKTVRIPLGVDTQRFAFVQDPMSIREKLGLPLDRPILLTVRRLVARMGLENLITAMSYVARRVPDVLLLVGGQGYLENILRTKVHQLHLDYNVKFLGFIPEESLPKYYQAADLFVLPTMALEGFGLVTIEAWSCGTPVVATSIGANAEVVGALGNEFLCQDTTAEAIAERIIWWVEHGITSELRKFCREYCEKNFSSQHVANSIEKVLWDVAMGH